LPRRRVGEVLELVGLTAAARRRAGGYSLGMRQRLGIAAALLGDPPVLLLDEPVNGLDPEGIRWIRSFLRALAAEGRAVLVSSHLMSELEGTADHLVVIGRGRLIADKPVGELLAGEHVRVRTPQPGRLTTVLANAGARVESSGDDLLVVTGLPAPRIANLAAEDRVPVYELAPQRAALEDVFIELTQGAVEYST
jgi:ABC-2 type transport system ATP-binding protein